MPGNAWSLLIFTLLSQMSVGAFCVAELINHSYSKKFTLNTIHPLHILSYMLVLTTVFFAAFASIFHLNNWANAYHAFNNWKTSWISKEIIFFFLFIFFLAFLTLLKWRRNEMRFLHLLISVLCAMGGIALILSMAKIYMLPTTPVWNTLITPGLFFTSSLLLGCLAILCLFAFYLSSSSLSPPVNDVRERWNRKTLPNLISLSQIFIVLGIILTGLFTYKLIEMSKEYGAGAFSMSPDRQMLFFLRILFYLLGLVFLILYSKKKSKDTAIENRSNTTLYLAVGFIFFAEILGRYLFYASFYRVGL